MYEVNNLPEYVYNAVNHIDNSNNAETKEKLYNYCKTSVIPLILIKKQSVNCPTQ